MKNLKKLLALTLVFAMTFALVACGGGDAGPEAGTYNITSAEALGITFEGDDLKDIVGEGGMSIELDGNGKATINYDNESSDGKYEIDGEKIIFDGDAEALDATLVDDTITIKESSTGMTMVLKK